MAGLGGDQVEGRQAVRELLRAGRRRVDHVLMADELTDIAELAKQAGVTVRRVTKDQIDALARSDAPQGVLARAAPLFDHDLAEMAMPDRPFVVVLDGVTDPQNLGAIMRSALAAGATGLVVGRHRSAPLSPAALKAAAGAAEYLPIATAAGIPAALTELAKSGIWTVGLDAGASGRLWDLDLASEPLAMVLGAEGRGLSRLVRQRCEVTVAIPMAGPLGSLNVAAAAALACFEVARRRAVG